ncbi:5'-methylthioadenosine/S-adenosylhomocysteine nucleosidase [Streptomyces sp. NPDC005381]|uniref:5'-methylthioadenosine/S-adenosylhomocysteine nucleosidase n=1 Tax=Streptomyces sp. NPDC005381 TaxID=3364714 RepID=UPI00369D9FC7
MTQIPGSVYRPGLAVLTALPKEYAAVKALLSHPVLHSETDHQGTRHYAFGTMPARGGGRHEIALTLVGVGNNISAVATTQLLNDLPSVRTVILSGIAGGVPDAGKAEHHVRLGDIVVSSEYGVIQYDFVKEETGRVVPRHPPRPSSSNLVRAARMIEAEALFGARPWDELVDHVLAALNWKRPPDSTDRLAASDDPSVVLRHPADPLRIKRRPRVFVGPIASANTLLKSPERRDLLRDLYAVKAVEMEGSGTADAAWMGQAQHFVVRGICDYCDSQKGDDWQNYAAAAAAGYLGAVLKAIDPLERTADPPARRNSVRPEAARTRAGRFDLPGVDDGTLRRIDETQAWLRSMLAENGSEAPLLVPTLSWIASIDRKFHENRLLAREAQALEAVHAEVRRSRTCHEGNRMSPVERLSLDLLERYESSALLRASWEVRCAIGNSLTLAVSAGSQGSRSSLVTRVMDASASGENWDMAQMLFDALHHAEQLTRQGREFLMTTAVEHEHRQVRWNVASALKSIQLSDGDLHRILGRLLRDPSPWVVKELIDVGLRNRKVMVELEKPGNAAMVLELIEQDDQLLEHTTLTLRSRGRGGFVPRFATLEAAGADEDPGSTGYGRRTLAEDFRRVEELKASLTGHHGKLYKAAERVVLDRIADPDPERQQSAITGYLHSTHDALAWASVRALFSGKLDGCHDDFLTQALSDMLTHPSDWIRRECVEETLRLEDGRRKYMALRQIEAHRNELARGDEIRPYLVDIGMHFKE